MNINKLKIISSRRMFGCLRPRKIDKLFKAFLNLLNNSRIISKSKSIVVRMKKKGLFFSLKTINKYLRNKSPRLMYRAFI